jgi:hypothetical protein
VPIVSVQFFQEEAQVELARSTLARTTNAGGIALFTRALRWAVRSLLIVGSIHFWLK